MTRRLIAVPLALATAAVLATTSGCGSDTGSGGGGAGGSGDTAMGDLANSAFVSTSVTKDGNERPLVDGGPISLRFWDSRLSASAGCNILGGSAAFTDGVIDVAGGLSMTEMGCDQPLMRQDDWLAGLLAAKPTATLDGDRLTLTSGGTVVEFLDEETANPDRPLVGTQWTLESIGESGADGTVGSVPDGVESTLAIDDSGRVSIRPGCNSGGGQAEVGDGVITFGPIALTRMACPGAPMDVESSVLAVVDGDVSYTIDADTLTLTRGSATLTYRAHADAGQSSEGD